MICVQAALCSMPEEAFTARHRNLFRLHQMMLDGGALEGKRAALEGHCRPHDPRTYRGAESWFLTRYSIRDSVGLS
jgi:hypothetical protein